MRELFKQYKEKSVKLDKLPHSELNYGRVTMFNEVLGVLIGLISEKPVEYCSPRDLFPYFQKRMAELAALEETQYIFGMMAELQDCMIIAQWAAIKELS